MAGITNVDFSEYEITELGIRISPATKADILKCVGKLEEELTSKTVQKKCGSKVIKTRTKGTGSGALKFSAYTPQDMLVDMHGMSRKDLKDGIVAYGQSSLHAVACVTAKILNEDGDVKYKAYPNCTITNGLSRTVDNDTEDVSMLELEIAVMPDEHGEGMYEAVETDLQDATAKTKWMEEFSRELVELNA